MFLKRSEIEVFEVKSDYAVEEATGANEIIRQFNSHKEFLFKGSSFEQGDYASQEFYLVFSVSEGCYEHVQENQEIYRNLIKEPGNNVVFMDADCTVYDPLFGGGFDNDGELSSQVYGYKQQTLG